MLHNSAISNVGQFHCSLAGLCWVPCAMSSKKVKKVLDPHHPHNHSLVSVQRPTSYKHFMNINNFFSMGAGRHGQGKCKVLFLLQMLSKVSIDEVFMHYFEKMLSAFGGSAPGPPGGLPSFRPPHCPPLGKILRVPCSLVMTPAFRQTSRLETTTRPARKTCLYTYIRSREWN